MRRGDSACTLILALQESRQETGGEVSSQKGRKKTLGLGVGSLFLPFPKFEGPACAWQLTSNHPQTVAGQRTPRVRIRLGKHSGTSRLRRGFRRACEMQHYWQGIETRTAGAQTFSSQRLKYSAQRGCALFPLD